jgi:hypothetical protein
VRDIFAFFMTYPAFAFIVMLASMVIYNRQLGIKIAIKFWWTPYPNHKIAFSWKAPKKEHSKIRKWNA